MARWSASMSSSSPTFDVREYEQVCVFSFVYKLEFVQRQEQTCSPGLIQGLQVASPPLLAPNRNCIS